MDSCSVCVVFICNFKLFLLCYYIVTLFISQGVDCGSYLRVEQSTEPSRQKLWFRVFPNYHLRPVVLVGPPLQSPNTISMLPSSSPQTQTQNKKEKNRMWIHSFLIPSYWAKYLPNNRNEEQRLKTRQDNPENVTRPFEARLQVTGNYSGTRTLSNNNLPRIVWIRTLPLWPGENWPSYIRYNSSDVPKNDYVTYDYSQIQEPSGIGGSRQGMAGLSGLEGDHTRTRRSKPSEEGRRKPWVHFFLSYPGWSEGKPEISSGSIPQSVPKKWFVWSPTLPFWPGSVQNFGYNEQLLNIRNQVNQRPQGSRMSRRVLTRPIWAVSYDSNPRGRPLGLIDLPKTESSPTQLMYSDENDCSQYKKSQNNTLGVGYISSTPAGIQGSRQGMPQLKGLEGRSDGIYSTTINNIRYLPIWSNELEREKPWIYRFINQKLWPGNIQNSPIPSSVSSSQRQYQIGQKPEFATSSTPKTWTGSTTASFEEERKKVQQQLDCLP